ncbi:hypothetical protein HDV00_007137 [Rhizophlyctis rosea]|nr:hypothetical protein HDV00_007137 [Rhizophlyctis rosea]
MPADAMGTLETKVLTANSPSSKALYGKGVKGVFAKVSLDEIDWRKTAVRTPTDESGKSITLDGAISLPLSDQPKVYVEVVIVGREHENTSAEREKEEVVGKAKVHLKEAGILQKKDVDVETELHHHLHGAGSVRLHLSFVEKQEESGNPHLLKDVQKQQKEQKQAQKHAKHGGHEEEHEVHDKH